MAKRKARFPVGVVICDPTQDLAEVRDPQTGVILIPFQRGTRLVSPGDYIELDEDEIKRIHGLHGTWEEREARLGPARAAAEQNPKVSVMTPAPITYI